MAPPGELNLLKEPQRKDKEKESYNGYITTSVASVDRPQFTSWTFLNGKVRIGPVESGNGFILLCLLWLVFASVPEGTLHGICSVVQRIFTIFLPLVCLICVFYWAELLIHKHCKSQLSYAVFPVCLLGELCTQIILGGSDFLRTTFLFTLVMAGLVTVVFSKLKILPTSIALLLLTTARMSCWITLRDIPSFLRPFLAYFSAFSGLILSRNIQACFTASPVELIQSKAPLTRRRTSSVSSTSSLNSRRRPSLPALGTQPKGTVDCTTLGEAHGMISDLLADSNLPSNVASTLKIISTMIAPPTAFHVGQRPFMSPMTPLIEKFRDEHQEDKVKDQPDLKDDLPLPMVGRIRRTLNATGRRMSSTWTTTTSATGMPTLDPDVTVGRNTPVVTLTEHNNSNVVTANKSPQKSPLAEGAITTTKNGPQETFAKHRPACFSNSFPTQSSPNLIRKLSPEMAPSGSPLIPRWSPDRTNSSPISTPNLMRKSPERMFATSNVFRRLSREETQLVKDALVQAENEPEEKNSEKDEISTTLCGCDCHHNNSSSTEEETKMNQTTKDSEKKSTSLEDKRVLPKSKELDKLLDEIVDWNFPIFDASEHGNILTQVTYRVFQKTGLFEAFKIPMTKFLNFFFALESGYHDIPYHNSIHASDVLHGVFFMTTSKIPGFCPVNSKLSNDSDTDSDSALNGGERQKTTGGGYGVLMDSIPQLELLALYTAATMHDYDHPGRTNAFLVGTLSQQALLYNDRSVLENHHAAAAFTLLMSDPKYNFLCELEPVEFKRFRFLAIEAILATDLKRHFDLLSEFNAKISEGGGVDWTQEADRLLTLQICIKMADISGPSKGRDLHTRWTKRIVEEFYEQGDDESARGMPISPYMNRDVPHVAQLQESFINHLVAPLYNAYANAGLLPGNWVEEEESSSDLESDDEDSDEEGMRKPEGERRKPKKSCRQKQPKITSDLTTNIENNYKMWLEVIKLEEEKRKAQEVDCIENVDKDLEGSDEELIMIETSLKNDVIVEEDNGSESGSTTMESRKRSDK
ncbi:cGMP-inhibited 3',5'-cyclic phosphodiesterase 3A-like [Acropora palmata]|uniref:cGMP-inhibited 3',5'-cyclic phosphodiesterase 3A-like n=1 Tax=Acropora palmata TaxID=6131 RepID=UPI003DA137CF